MAHNVLTSNIIYEIEQLIKREIEDKELDLGVYTHEQKLEGFDLIIYQVLLPILTGLVSTKVSDTLKSLKLKRKKKKELKEEIDSLLGHEINVSIDGDAIVDELEIILQIRGFNRKELEVLISKIYLLINKQSHKE